MNRRNLTGKELIQGIRLDSKTAKAAASVFMKKEDTIRYRQLLSENREVFFACIKEQKNYRLLFLRLYLDFAEAAYPEYRMRGIPDEIYFDTFNDITVWAGNCKQDYGEIGIEEYDWLWRHITLKLFRLGRLQFEIIRGEEEPVINKIKLKPGERMLNLHIPQGEVLCYDACVKSLEQAAAFFEPYREITCHSWLLAPALQEILPETSNILKFQSLFEIYELDEESREAEERVYGRSKVPTAEYQETTFLQRELKKYLQSGKNPGSAFGRVREPLN